MVRRGSLGCGVAQLACGAVQRVRRVAQIVARRLAERQARVWVWAQRRSSTERKRWRQQETVLGELCIQYTLTIDAPLILKMRDIIFFFGQTT